MLSGVQRKKNPRKARVAAQLLKQSEHIKEWRDRYFWLRVRRVYYYENEEDATSEVPPPRARNSTCPGR